MFTSAVAKRAGIGKAIVEEFAQLGASVYTCCRTQEALDALLGEWQGKDLKVEGCVADVSTEGGRNALMTGVQESFGGALCALHYELWGLWLTCA